MQHSPPAGRGLLNNIKKTRELNQYIQDNKRSKHRSLPKIKTTHAISTRHMTAPF